MAWKKLTLLGAGTFGSVYLAAEASQNDSFLLSSAVAVKSTPLDITSSVESEMRMQLLRLSSLQNEAKLLYELRDCEYIVQGFGVDVSSEQGRNVYNLVLEYASGGTLDEMIEDYSGWMSESEIATYAHMLLKGLSNIHRKDIVHCDFKPANILVNVSVQEDRQEKMIELKIADFSSSKKVDDQDWGTSRCTLHYASPESVFFGLNEKAGDIWALGCIVVEMITGTELWSSNSEDDLSTQIAYESPKIPQHISEDAKDFLGRCLDRDRSERWTAEMLLSHPFILKNTMLSSSITRRQEVKRPWFCSRGMFSRPMTLVPFL